MHEPRTPGGKGICCLIYNTCIGTATASIYIEAEAEEKRKEVIEDQSKVKQYEIYKES